MPQQSVLQKGPKISDLFSLSDHDGIRNELAVRNTGDLFRNCLRGSNVRPLH
jgi:hypothetical protein